MSIVVIDTQILYWAIVGQAVSGSESLIKPARDFMKWLDTQNHDIYIPSIVVGEMLIPVEESNMVAVLSQFQSDWMIIDYDMRAAMQFAKIRRDHIIKKRFKEIRNLHPDVTKKELLADAMIIATAIGHNADIIYSHNRDLRTLAKGWIEAKNFMDENFQLSLLDD